MVYVLLGNGFEETEAIAPVDILRRAGAEVCYAAVSSCTAEGMHGIKVSADIPITEIDLDKTELLVLPGGDVKRPGNYGSDEKARALIRAVFDRGIPIAAICAAPTVLAELGITEGKNAVCYPGMEGLMAGAKMRPGEKTVKDGKLITGQGPGAAVDFGLNLAAFLKGRDAAEVVRGQLHYPEIKYA